MTGQPVQVAGKNLGFATNKKRETGCWLFLPCMQKQYIIVHRQTHATCQNGPVVKKVKASHPAVDCHYLPPGLRLPSQRQSITGIKLYCLVTEAHRCEQLAQGCCVAFAPSTIWTHDLLISTRCATGTVNPAALWNKGHIQWVPHCVTLGLISGSNSIAWSLTAAELLLPINQPINLQMEAKTARPWQR